MSAADKLLTRLDGARETGAGQWIATCPAHDDRSPSLSIRELPDGRVLINDFGGCEPGDVLAAVGLEFRDLYPEPLPGAKNEGLPPVRRPFPAADALKALAHELTVAVFIMSDATKAKRPVSDADADRLAEIAGRVGAALGVTELMSNLVYGGWPISGGLPADYTLINAVDELDSVNDVGQLLKTA